MNDFLKVADEEENFFAESRVPRDWVWFQKTSKWLGVIEGGG